MLKKVDRLFDYLLKIGIIAITISVVSSMLLQILDRYFLDLPVVGLDELTGHMAVWFYMLGAAYSASRSDHIRADMLEVFRVPLKIRRGIDLASSLVCIVISGYMMVWSYNYVLWSISRQEITPSLHIPTVYFQTAILVGAALMFAYFIRELIAKCRPGRSLGEE